MHLSRNQESLSHSRKNIPRHCLEIFLCNILEHSKESSQGQRGIMRDVGLFYWFGIQWHLRDQRLWLASALRPRHWILLETPWRGALGNQGDTSLLSATLWDDSAPFDLLILSPLPIPEAQRCQKLSFLHFSKKICELMTKVVSLPFQRRKHLLPEVQKSCSWLTTSFPGKKSAVRSRGDTCPIYQPQGLSVGQGATSTNELQARGGLRREPGSQRLVSSVPILKFCILSTAQKFLGSPHFNKVRYGQLLRGEAKGNPSEKEELSWRGILQ